MGINNEKLTSQQTVARLMKLAVNCADKNWDASVGDGNITISADEAFALFLLVRFANSHPTYIMDDGKPEKLCMAQGAVAYIEKCLEGVCPDCGRHFDDPISHEDTCSNHCNEYPMPDDAEMVSNEPHPPKRECH